MKTKRPLSARESFEGARANSEPEVFAKLEAAIDEGRLGLVKDGECPDLLVGGSWPSKTPGALRAVCSACGAYVSLTPQSGAPMLARFPDVVISCYPCAALAEDLFGFGG